ncbi:hypothetical protein BDW62DRAFT_217267 [Aspergillus aurantiobrunneus]
MTIFVCGATGTQGGAIARHLLATNIAVHALTRDASSPRSQALEATGVTLSPGDYDDSGSLRAALQGCTGLFLNLSPNLADLSQELTQAKHILSIAKSAGVQHVVYSSGLVHEPHRRKHWDPDSFTGRIILSKIAVENAVRTAGFNFYTILRPGYFMSNFLVPYIAFMYPGLTETGTVVTAYTADTVLPLVDPYDIGQFGAAAFREPGRFHAQEIAIASEVLRLEGIMGALGRATGRALEVRFMEEGEIERRKSTDMFLGGQLMGRDMAESVDMDEVRAWGIALGRFQAFLERERARVVETFGLPG